MSPLRFVLMLGVFAVMRAMLLLAKPVQEFLDKLLTVEEAKFTNHWIRMLSERKGYVKLLSRLVGDFGMRIWVDGNWVSNWITW